VKSRRKGRRRKRKRGGGRSGRARERERDSEDMMRGIGERRNKTRVSKTSIKRI
jgi:hypothetical protein